MDSSGEVNELISSMWRVEGLQRRPRPNLRQGDIFMRNIQSLKVAGGASELDRIVVQPGMFSGGLSANRVTAGVEVVGSRGGVPELEVSADGGSVFGDKLGDGGLGVDSGVVAEEINGEWEEEEVGFLWVGGDEGAGEERDLEHVLAEVVSELRVEGVGVGEEDGGEGSE